MDFFDIKEPPTMDFRSLLDQFQKDATHLASSSSSTMPSTTTAATTAARERRREDGDNNLSSSNKKRQRITATADNTSCLSTTIVRNIFCLCPAGVETGGPEALHQLCDMIHRCSGINSSTTIDGEKEENDEDNKPTTTTIPTTTTTTRVSAYMLYLTESNSSSGKILKWARHATTPTIYQSYQVPTATWDPRITTTTRHDNNDTSLLIWPEVWTDAMLDYLDNNTAEATTFSATATANGCCQCAIWWLSVDNNNGRFQEWHRRDVIHLVQSEYARQYVIRHGVPLTHHIFTMTEYISNIPKKDESLVSSLDVANTTQQQQQQLRDLDVLYNPLKGLHYTDAIRKRSQGLCSFQPINGDATTTMMMKSRISPAQVRQRLQRAKIYLDFGPHPGMDRLPREAAMCGCVIITNQQGAASYEEDVPIPQRYKIKSFDVDVIHQLLRNVLEQWNDATHDFDNYRTWIVGQEDQMQQCVQEFLKVVVDQRQQGKTK